MEFKEDGLVWAKHADWPFWPARVARPEELRDPKARKHKRDEILVYFFGSHNYAWVPKKMIYDYDQRYGTYSKTGGRNPDFKTGLDEAQEFKERTTVSSGDSAKKSNVPSTTPPPTNRSQIKSMTGTPSTSSGGGGGGRQNMSSSNSGSERKRPLTSRGSGGMGNNQKSSALRSLPSTRRITSTPDDHVGPVEDPSGHFEDDLHLLRDIKVPKFKAKKITDVTPTLIEESQEPSKNRPIIIKETQPLSPEKIVDHMQEYDTPEKETPEKVVYTSLDDSVTSTKKENSGDSEFVDHSYQKTEENNTPSKIPFENTQVYHTPTKEEVTQKIKEDDENTQKIGQEQDTTLTYLSLSVKPDISFEQTALYSSPERNSPKKSPPTKSVPKPIHPLDGSFEYSDAESTPNQFKIISKDSKRPDGDSLAMEVDQCEATQKIVETPQTTPDLFPKTKRRISLDKQTTKIFPPESPKSNKRPRPNGFVPNNNSDLGTWMAQIDKKVEQHQKATKNSIAEVRKEFEERIKKQGEEYRKLMNTALQEQREQLTTNHKEGEAVLRDKMYKILKDQKLQIEAVLRKQKNVMEISLEELKTSVKGTNEKIESFKIVLELAEKREVLILGIKTEQYQEMLNNLTRQMELMKKGVTDDVEKTQPVTQTQ